MKISLQLSQSQLRAAAMTREGLSPKAWGMKPGTRVERNRKAAAKRGYAKHKGKAFDC